MPPCIPENPGSSPNNSIILCEVAFGGGSDFPPPVFPMELLSRLISFLAAPHIDRHLSFTSVVERFATPRALTLWLIDCQTACFFLFVSVLENFSLITSRFSSANCNIKLHSAEEKFAFLARLQLSILFFPPKLHAAN
jgi:hypothetical protein